MLRQHPIRAALVGLATIALGSGVAAVINQVVGIGLILWAVLIFLAVGVLERVHDGGRFEMTIKEPGADPPRTGDIHAKNVSINQSGGITGDIHLGAPKRMLAGPGVIALEQDLRKLGDRTLGLTAVMGNAESYDFAVQISELVDRAGWTLDPVGVSQAVYSKPLKGIVIAVPAKRQEDVDPAILRFGRWLADNRLGPVAIELNSGTAIPQIHVGPPT